MGIKKYCTVVSVVATIILLGGCKNDNRESKSLANPRIGQPQSIVEGAFGAVDKARQIKTDIENYSEEQFKIMNE